MTVPHSPRIDELLPAFALGALEDDERREVEEHLTAGCAACDAEQRRLAGDLEELAAGVAPMAVTAELKRQLLAQVAAEPRTASLTAATPAPAPPPAATATPIRQRRLAAASRPGGRASRWSWLAAAALLLVAVWGVARQASLGSEIERLRGQRDQLAARADSLARRMAQVQGEAERLARTLSIIAAPGVQSVQLAGMGPSHAAVGRAYVNASDRKAVFYAFGLPAVAPDKTYQLWFIDEDEHKASAGVFGVDAHGQASVVVDELIPVDRIQAWVVTVEPRGGRPQPTGPIALAG